MERLGIIDLGSNSSRLIIYDILPNKSYRPVFEMKQNIRLAQNMTEKNRISDAGIMKAVACTKLFLRAGMLHGVTKWVSVATAAIRQSANRDEVLSMLQDETDISFRVLGGEEEGRYGFLGAINTLDVNNALLVDIGGASSELTLVENRNLRHVTSIPYGALNLSEKFRDVAEEELGDKIKQFFTQKLDDVSWLKKASKLPVVGLGGTARAVAKLDISGQGLPLERIHGYPISKPVVLMNYERLKATPAAKRKKIKGLTKSRSDIIVGGLAAISAILEYIDSPELIVSRCGLREGIFFEYLLNDQDSPIVSSVLDHSIRNFQRVFHVNKQVANVVAAAATQLFDKLQDIHGLSENERKLLWVTAQIESCGCYINTEKWTKHSAYLVLTSFLYGLSYSQLTDIASLLEGKGRAELKKLLIFIRLAKLLTLQLGIVPDTLVCQVEGEEVQIGRARNIKETVLASAEAELQDEFQKTFGYRLSYLDFSTV